MQDHFDVEPTFVQKTWSTTHGQRRGNECKLAGVAVIILVLNEEASLPLVLNDLPAVGQVFVVDNGSTDRSAQVAINHGTTVVKEVRRGYGAAYLAGIAAITVTTAVQTRPEVVVFLDGDYSDHPEFLLPLVSPILEGRADFVVGSRMLGPREPGAMPPVAVFGNWLSPLLMWVCWEQSFPISGPFGRFRGRRWNGSGCPTRTLAGPSRCRLKRLSPA
ncbi:MAG: glycosyltransferase family 2 protein [Planctomycetaceae bacterium]|nr:glycosyltransferase family 2 protein [Planctomycetaceae bacterium]